MEISPWGWRVLAALMRKAIQVGKDPILRRWLWSRTIGQEVAPPSFARRAPPYLEGMAFGDMSEAEVGRQIHAHDKTQTSVLLLALAGEDIQVTPGQEAAIFTRVFTDLETQLSLFRFAWLPLNPDADKSSVIALWNAFVRKYGDGKDQWAWHPYTATERAIHLIDYVDRHGAILTPENWRKMLANHARAVMSGLEYFGDAHTGNHLANNGRGLYRIGLELRSENIAAIGLRILLEEAKRIFLKSGMLREESSHYHLLLARNYADCWLAARRKVRPEAQELEKIVSRALAAARALRIAGGMPMIGDISPDCPPAHLCGLLPNGDTMQGWCGLLSEADRNALKEVRDNAASVSLDATDQDGWLRFESGGWSGLWHLSPDGWSMMPGHGHQDAGSFEIHWGADPLFVDPGRGSYGEAGTAALYRSACVHNGLTIDDADPYPANKPYYSERFRASVGGSRPTSQRFDDGLLISHSGYNRLGVGQVTRRWRFSDSGFLLEDRVDGSGQRKISRRLITPGNIKLKDRGAEITLNNQRFIIQSEKTPTVENVMVWHAYGRGAPAGMLNFSDKESLPWVGRLRVERI